MDVLKTIQTVDTVIKIAKPIIDSVCDKLVPEMKDFADRLYDLSGKYPSLEVWADAINTAADFLGDVLYAIGIAADPADELGLKAEKADKSMSDFESVKDYIEYLHNEIKLDEDELKNLSPIERTAYQAAGMAVEAGALGEKFNTDISADFVLLLSKIKNISDIVVGVADLISILSSLKDSGIERMDDVCDYIEAKGDSDRIRTGEAMRNAFKEHFGDLGAEIIEILKTDTRRS